MVVAPPAAPAEDEQTAEWVVYFKELLSSKPSISAAIAAIETLIEYIQQSSGGCIFVCMLCFYCFCYEGREKGGETEKGRDRHAELFLDALTETWKWKWWGQLAILCNVHLRDANGLLLILFACTAATLAELRNGLKSVITALTKSTDSKITSVSSGCELFLRFITLKADYVQSFEECKNQLVKHGRFFWVCLLSGRKHGTHLAGLF